MISMVILIFNDNYVHQFSNDRDIDDDTRKTMTLERSIMFTTVNQILRLINT